MPHPPQRSPKVLEAAFQKELDRAMHGTLLHGVGPFGMFFLVLAVPLFLLNREGIGFPMAVLSILTGSILLALVPLLRRVAVPKSSLHPLTTGVILVVAGNPLAHQALTGKSFHASTLMLVIVASGYMILRTGWFFLVSAGILLVWLGLAMHQGMTRLEIHFLIGLLSAFFVGFILHRTRLAFIREGVRRRERLREALKRVATLKGLIPICANCKKIRDDQGYWNQVEVYVQAHSGAEFTHGICPECATRMKAEWTESIRS